MSANALHHVFAASSARIVTLAVYLAACGCLSPDHAQTGADVLATGKEVESPVQPSLREPTGPDRCRFCHPAEVEGYARSAMARALRRPGQESAGTVTANGTTITIHSSPGGFTQTWENSGERADYRVDYVIGSGEHASGYLVNLGGHLFQSPVAFYKSRQSYDLAPGYESVRDPDFTRPVPEECVLCHSGSAQHVPGTLNQYRSLAFTQEGITCERCHGPAERHLADPRVGTIVNPSKLPRAARDSVCEQCHLFGVARVPNPGKKLSDFLPGQPLEDTFTIYRNVLPSGAASGDFKVISHVEQLALSSCARKSDGRLWCVSCHNPHEKLTRSVDYYRARCLSCHTAALSSSHPRKDSDCLGCHMPRRDAKDGGHTVFTDHRIQRRPDKPSDLPSDSGIAAWREPSPDLQKRNLGIAFVDVGMQRHSPSFILQGYRNLAEVQRQFSQDPDFFRWIGEALFLAKDASGARLAFDRALQLDPHSALAEASVASAHILEGDDDGAITHLERAVKLDPLFLPAASTLMDLYQKHGKLTEAASLSARARAAMNPSPAPSTERRTTQEVFKNIRVLKDISPAELVPAMEFISSALGVECTFCHVEGQFEKDDKRPKQRAREMIEMTFALNSNSFNGLRTVTCYSCHRGASHPAATPAFDTAKQQDPSPAALPTSDLPSDLPTAAQLLDTYVKALGGPAAVERVMSRTQRGVASFHGQSIGIELFAQSPDKWALVRHFSEGESVAVFDGQSGWISSPGRPGHEMHRSEVDAARMDADLQFPLHIQQLFPELRVEYPEVIEGREAYILMGRLDGQPAVKFCFGEQSGLLLRVVRYSDSPLGLNTLQVDYADYRDVAGVQVPFRVTLSQPGSSSTIQFHEVLQNVAIDPSRFAKPLPH